MVTRYPTNFDDKKDPEIYTGRAEGLRLVLDAHTDKLASASIADNFRGFHVVIDGKEKYPFTSRNGILIKAGQTNEIAISATRFEADPKIKKVTDFHPFWPKKIPKNTFFGPNQIFLKLDKSGLYENRY